MLTAAGFLNALDQSMIRISESLDSGGFKVCKMMRHIGEPPQLICCDCAKADKPYTIVGWIGQVYQADADLAPAFPFAKNTLDGVQMGFQITRCWPVIQGSTPRTDDPRDAVAAELTMAADRLWTDMTGCQTCPGNWAPWCNRFTVNPMEPRQSATETPYGQEGTLQYACAGWQMSIVVG